MVKSTNLFRTCNLYFVSQHVFGCWTWNARLLQVARTATKGEGTAVGVEIAIGLKNRVLKIKKQKCKIKVGKDSTLNQQVFLNKLLDALTVWLSLFEPRLLTLQRRDVVVGAWNHRVAFVEDLSWQKTLQTVRCDADDAMPQIITLILHTIGTMICPGDRDRERHSMFQSMFQSIWDEQSTS